MIREIRTYGDPVLREKAKSVEKVDSQVKQLVEDMFETMYASDGIGLAASQIGVSLRVVVIDLRQGDETKLVLINPELHTEGPIRHFTEGCLSVPGLSADVLRPEYVKVKYLKLDGETKTFQTDGLLARAIQHETDHLDGILYVDRLSSVRRALLGGKLRRLIKDFQSGKVNIDRASEKKKSLL